MCATNNSWLARVRWGQAALQQCAPAAWHSKGTTRYGIRQMRITLQAALQPSPAQHSTAQHSAAQHSALSASPPAASPGSRGGLSGSMPCPAGSEPATQGMGGKQGRKREKTLEGGRHLAKKCAWCCSCLCTCALPRHKAHTVRRLHSQAKPPTRPPAHPPTHSPSSLPHPPPPPRSCHSSTGSSQR